jgi:ubiquinone/menaquinone biosynthesis C-methylase UbiE
VGLDVDFESLAYGQRSYNYIRFVNAVAEFLPFQDACFDIVISRVSLPYTNIPKSLREISRVLKKGGRVWLTLHSFSGTISKLVTAFVEFNFKGVIHYIYVIMNGVALHLLGKQFVLPGIKKYDSCQSQRGIKKALEHAGFKNIVINTKKHFIISAQKL